MWQWKGKGTFSLEKQKSWQIDLDLPLTPVVSIYLHLQKIQILHSINPLHCTLWISLCFQNIQSNFSHNHGEKIFGCASISSQASFRGPIRGPLRGPIRHPIRDLIQPLIWHLKVRILVSGSTYLSWFSSRCDFCWNPLHNCGLILRTHFAVSGGFSARWFSSCGD